MNISNSKTISDITLLIIGVILTIYGIILLLFTGIATGINPEVDFHLISQILVKFIGSAYILLGLITIIVFKLKGRKKLYLLIFYITSVFINLYLQFELSNLIFISVAHLYFQLAFIIIVLIVLIDEVLTILKTRNKLD
tara:strand:+ start:859 stop:1275 length:417 start_codon:yes stop_codon:yes gene_type:complete